MSTIPLAAEMTPGLRVLRRGRRCLTWGLLAMGVGTIVTITGCASALDVSALKPGSQLNKRESIDGIMGPTERKLKQVAWERQKRELTAGRNPEDRAALAAYASAEKRYKAGRYKDAEKAFKELAKSRRWNGRSWAERATDAFQKAATGSHDPMFDQYGDPIEEDALFMIAESQFAQKKYSWAQDSYGELVERYPSSRHLDDTAHRLFEIAHTWMGFPKPDDQDQVDLASGELLRTNPRTGDKKFAKPSFLNVTDGSRPKFDTAGRALQALESIWLNDANGPLADDALMLTANYHLQTGDFVEAARVYQLLREQYPDSPHFKDAYVLESHVRLAAYEGPEYDAKGLQESKELKRNALELFPDLTETQQKMLTKELDNISVAEERREWHQVEFYKQKGDDTAVALHCNKILNRFPDSRYANAARRELEAIADRQRDPGFSLFGNSSNGPVSPVLEGIVTRPGRRAPTGSGTANAPGRAEVSPDRTPPKGQPKTKTQDDPGFFRRFLRRTETDPKLKPVDDESDTGKATL